MTDLTEAGANWVEAHKRHSEAFLRYKALDAKRTDKVALAMADLDVDLKAAEVAWHLAMVRWELTKLEIYVKRVSLGQEGYDAYQQSTGYQEPTG